MKNLPKFLLALFCVLMIVDFSCGASPAVPTAVITPVSLYTENDATCTATYTDGDADDGSINFSMYVNSVLISTCNYPVSTGTEKTCVLNHINYHADDVINCSVTVTDNTSASSSHSVTKTVLGATSGTGMLGDSSSGLIGITKDIVSYIPFLVDLVIEIVPLLFIFMFVGWLTGLFDGILDMMNMSGLKIKK